MHGSNSLNWLQYEPQGASPVDIKVEASYSDPSFRLLSPPSSPSITRSGRPSANTPPPPLSRRQSNPSSSSLKRVNPYPSSPRDSRLVSEDATKMATAPAYGSWSQSALRGGDSKHPVDRRSSDGEQEPGYSLSNIYTSHSFPSRASENRPASSSSSITSSLTGAVEEAHINPSARALRSPPLRGPTAYGPDVHEGMIWTPSSQVQTETVLSHNVYPGVIGHGHSSYNNNSSMPTMSTTNSQYPQQYHDYKTYHNPSPESLSPDSPAFAQTSYTDQFSYQPPRSTSHISGAPFTPVPSSSSGVSPSVQSISQERVDIEVRRLRNRVRELEFANEHSRNRIRGLEAELANGIPYPQPGSSSSVMSMTGLPSPLSTPSPQCASFQASWKARTEARIREFCSLNRAGNALCAWHDSRRERRAYPPRMAPPGYLNCGCTFEEALFEESLSRHGVGSYHPGENVRMDPALRNPLLKLLEERYGYRDGDFERNSLTGDWIEGEGHLYWEQRAQAGLPHSRRPRGDSDRR